MPRADLRLIIDAERKTAEERINQLKIQHELEIIELELEHRQYKERRDAMDYVWTVAFVIILFLIVAVLV